MPNSRSIRPPAVAVTATTLVVLFALAAGAGDRRPTAAGVALAHAVVGPMAEGWFSLATVQLAPRCESSATFDRVVARQAQHPHGVRQDALPATAPGTLHLINLPPPTRG